MYITFAMVKAVSYMKFNRGIEECFVHSLILILNRQIFVRRLEKASDSVPSKILIS